MSISKIPLVDFLNMPMIILDKLTLTAGLRVDQHN